MSDVFTAKKRSEVMSKIKGHNTKPEILLRSIIHRMGYRFTINGKNNKLLPGKPDIILPRFKTIIFVQGCFWHGHESCNDFKLPKSRREFWLAKIEKNRNRDIKNTELLTTLGWNVLNIWVCSFETKKARESLIDKLPSLIVPDKNLGK